jgi:hypothetical protein
VIANLDRGHTPTAKDLRAGILRSDGQRLVEQISIDDNGFNLPSGIDNGLIRWREKPRSLYFVQYDIRRQRKLQERFSRQQTCAMNRLTCRAVFFQDRHPPACVG